MMENTVQAGLALDALPIGSQVAAAFIDGDHTATIVLFEHREHDGGRAWWDLTRRQAWWSAGEIARAFDDMVVTAKPDIEAPGVTTKMTGRLRFRYADGTWLEWSTKEPTTPAHIHETITKFADLDLAPLPEGAPA